ncbi:MULTISPECIES: DUF2279 domain-containing protein [Hymenobacter]|uniref:DUF2279 domain-containing protein n=1 Tax=Hymenobacter wooponensis TaxID=1525360 RepID=A0A4Z0MCA4_9BACT|nr:DUF2279 domain-containing protein [Hymenobacter wooponensis]TGD77372.1 DUF2279 domain-containing protein [Hymenobacter wooponensis]
MYCCNLTGRLPCGAGWRRAAGGPLLSAAWLSAALLQPSPAAAQVPRSKNEDVPSLADSSRHAARLPVLAGSVAVVYPAGLYLLGRSWYTGERVPLHWFNDWPEWKQLDKAGHFWTAFHESRAAVDLLGWAGVAERRSRWYGSFVGFLLQSPIELLDGRSPAYGASPGDLAANLAGSVGLLTQQLAWGQVRLMPKVSFHRSPYAAQRPDVLGRTLPERLLKDYNGQTYWVCADVGAWLPAGSRWPRWLQPAVGYGADQLLYNDPARNQAAGLRAYRQYYLSVDVDLRRVPTRSQVLRRVFYVASLVHLPAPALEWNARRGWHGHGLYY